MAEERGDIKLSSKQWKEYIKSEIKRRIDKKEKCGSCSRFLLGYKYPLTCNVIVYVHTKDRSYIDKLCERCALKKYKDITRYIQCLDGMYVIDKNYDK